MPQFDFYSYTAQVSWILLSFFIFHFFILRYYLVIFVEVLKFRTKLINLVNKFR